MPTATREKPLVHLIIPKWGGTGIHQTFGHRMPPMALLVLAAHARRAGWDVEVIDLNYDRSPLDMPDWEGPRTKIGLGYRRRSGKPDLRYRDPKVYDRQPFEADRRELEGLARASAAAAQEALAVAFREATTNVALLSRTPASTGLQ